MNSEIRVKQEIENALKKFLDEQQPLRDAAIKLLNVLGYHSQRVGNDEIDSNRCDRLVESALLTANPTDKLRINDWDSFCQIMQVADAEINQQVTPEQGNLFESSGIDDMLRTSYMFVAVQLSEDTYTRTHLADITRFINKEFQKPIMVIFRYGAVLTLAIINRRPNLSDSTKQVLEKVTLIKDIHLDSPKRAHIDIVSDLHLRRLIENEGVNNFDTLHKAWEGILNTEELNKQFYRKLFTWYEWAVKEATFPTDENRVIKPEEHVIRLITRLLFIWFIKEKGLVADELFKKAQIQDFLKEDVFDSGDSYYRAVLQNLFFATLNTEIDKRRFSTQTRKDHRNFSVYRYESQMDDSDRLLELFAETPFINGGLFDCLDTFTETGGGGCRIDCFSDRQYRKLSIPNRLFFDEEQGLIPLLEHYKFTVEENTPIDQEVALDPELLGRVFENLLAAINPETGETARKMTGSYYTPRAIVDYMVEEALIATLSQKCQPTDDNEIAWDERLRYLFDYAQMFDDASVWFDDRETVDIVKTISEFKILDPAVGSGAFPMGVLHKLTLALRRLDPDNNRWEALQKELAGKRAAAAFNTQNQQERDDELTEISETFERYRDSDFGRKLYLIQNSIFGVDIQPIACQIAKLRFFISLAIEQEPDKDAGNFGIKPLPNLETRFVAANTLIGLKLQMSFKNHKVVNLEQELYNNREKHFHATTRQQKRDCKTEDKRLRAELALELKELGAFADDADNIAQWDIYDQNATADWFDKELMFGVTDGFDVVIGNPPYISHDKISKQLKAKIKTRYESYQPFADKYCYFIEKALELQNKNGILSFITSNSYLRAEYGAPIRKLLLRKNILFQMINIEDSQVFEKTIVNVAIIMSRKSTNSTDDSCIVVNSPFSENSFADFVRTNNFNCPQAYFNSKSWNLAEPKLVELQRKLESSGKTLEEFRTKIRLGIATGNNEAFLIDENKKQELFEKNPDNAEIIKPILRGRDISRYSYTLSGQYILLAKNGVNIERNYPDIYKHLDSFGDKFKNRGAQGQHWTNLRACSFYDDFKKEKIVWIELSDLGRFALCKAEVYLLNSAYFLLPPSGIDSKYLLGILNSSTIRFYLSLVAETSGMGTSRWINNYVKEFPIPVVVHERQTEIIELVIKILAVKAADPDADTSNLENEIDKLVYDLYDLTDDEIAIVEGSV